MEFAVEYLILPAQPTGAPVGMQRGGMVTIAKTQGDLRKCPSCKPASQMCRDHTWDTVAHDTARAFQGCNWNAAVLRNQSLDFEDGWMPVPAAYAFRQRGHAIPSWYIGRRRHGLLGARWARSRRNGSCRPSQAPQPRLMRFMQCAQVAHWGSLPCGLACHGHRAQPINGIEPILT